jgi:hypothetical protein
MKMRHSFNLAVLFGCFLLLLPLAGHSGAIDMQPNPSAGAAESRAVDSQSETVPDRWSTCEEARSKMASEAKDLGPNTPTNIKDVPRTQAQLGWSDFATVVAPNRAWQVEVHPALTSDENLTPVIVRGCKKIGAWPLFVLQRDADMSWGPDSNSLLVVNKPLSGTNQLLFFNIQALSEDNQTQAPDKLDKTVQQVLIQRLREKNQVGFYLPILVSWKKDELLLAVGGTNWSAKSNPNSPLDEYCYGFMIDTNTLQVQEVLSAKELKDKFGAECQIMP